MPDIGVAIPVAAAFAAFVRFFAFGGVNFAASSNAIFGVTVSRLMNDVLIPISLFEGAYHVQQHNFWSQFGYGLTFAVVGTGVSAVFIAIMVKFTGEWGWHPVADWRQSFAYAAFIADVDPVATLSIFSNLKVDALLSTLVAGEATLNDPIALVIFGICNQKVKDLDFDPVSQIRGGMILLSGSIILGVIVGIVLSFLLNVLKVKGKGPLETMYVFLSAYFGYCLGEFLGFSGIITTLFSGLMMGIYAARICTDRHGVDSFINNFARLADTVMFIIIGFATFLINSWDGVKLGLLTVLFCFIARALMVMLLVPIINFVKRLRGYEGISFQRSFMIFHSGLRGGMTVMMALMLDPYWSEDQNVLLDATIVTVIGMTYLCGCTGPFFLKLVNVPMDVPQEDGTLEDTRSLSVAWLRKTDQHLSNAMGIKVADDHVMELSEMNLQSTQRLVVQRRATLSRFQTRHH
jgi:NhaP-type Na+/H+ or K+/H+ antiporter